MNYPIHTFLRNEPSSVLPKEFWQIEKPPKRINVQGSEKALELLKKLPEYGLAVVGTRKPQFRSLQLLERIMLELEGTPLIIVSGFARGVDTAAHEKALESSLPTVAILGGGTNKLYPNNPKLKAEILEADGLIISEFEPDQGPAPWQFIQRNRLIAAWTKATWVVEAPRRSGALNTAKWAREHHRNVYVTPSFPGDIAFAGNEDLIDNHHGIPVWNTSSFGQSWMYLAARRGKKVEQAEHNDELFPELWCSSRADQLYLQVKILTTQAGGAQVTDLLNWALSAGWSPQEFFLALQKSLQIGLVSDHQGVLISSGS